MGAGQQLGGLGPYTLLEQVAVGGMAEIYLAKTRGVAGFEKFLCLKVIHPNYADDEHFIEMLIDEAKIAVGLNHANIVQIFDLGRDGKTYFIAMEYIDGADLFKIMRRLSERDHDVPIDVAAYIAHEICTGLDYAHRKRDEQGRPLGIIHRDISPQNILVSKSGEVKIVDFGIAKAASRGRKTQAGVIKGKYYYMSPEQAWGDPVDQRSDIFSSGIILYEVLTGQMLYLEEDMHRLLDMVRKADIPRPTTKRPEIPPQLENVVMKALAKRPADRWQTAHEYQVALTNFLFSFAPDFTPSRLAALLSFAMDDAPPPAPRPDTSHRGTTRQVDVESLMSRVDYQPRTEHSVIFRVGDLIPDHVGSVDEEDRGERTMITGPPSMMPGLFVPGAPFSSSVSETDKTAVDWDATDLDAQDTDPTRVSVNPVLRPQDRELDGPRPRRRSRAIPAEVVVPRPQVTTDPSMRPIDPTRSDLTPTPVMEPPAPRPPPIPTGPGHSSWPQLPESHRAPAADQGQPPPAGGASWTPPQQQPAQAPPGQWPPSGQSWPQQQGWPQATAPQPGPPPPHPQQGWPQQPQPQSAQPVQPQPQGWPQQPQPQSWPQQGQATPTPNPMANWPTQPPDVGRVATTLSTDEVHGGRIARRRHRRVVLAALVTLLGLAVVAAVFLVVLFPMGEEGGTIEVISVPENADVLFNGQPINKRTPVVIPVTDLKQAYEVEVKLAKYQPWKRKLSLSAEDSRVRVLAVLTPIYGRLSVSSIPKGADIYVNGEHRGKTPATIENLLPTEDVALELRKRGYKPATRVLKWGDQTYLDAEVTLHPSR